jgi:hypothetical protein
MLVPLGANGEIARAHFRDLVEGKLVRVEVHGFAANENLFGFLSVQGTNVNLAMIRAGWALADRESFPAQPELFGQFGNAQNEARAFRRGIWAGDHGGSRVVFLSAYQLSEFWSDIPGWIQIALLPLACGLLVARVDLGKNSDPPPTFKFEFERKNWKGSLAEMERSFGYAALTGGLWFLLLLFPFWLVAILVESILKV